ncbi:MAG: hypothetical protein A2231_01385 [Candidatus Firestonebacteria bacterium RIFOXYA2_FULL_40_8]|nr:MAG: hypothetical protein A2231_01385 [Candidatus Firestonebacteria bacterium RIFOXYA2_FULL_40_8]
MDKQRSYNKNLVENTRGKAAAGKENISRQKNIKFTEKSSELSGRGSCNPLEKLTGRKCRP